MPRIAKDRDEGGDEDEVPRMALLSDSLLGLEEDADAESRSDDAPVEEEEIGAFRWPFAKKKIAVFFILIALTVADGVLVVILFDKYTDRYSQYLNQGTAGVYCFWSVCLLCGRWMWRRWRRNGEATNTKAPVGSLSPPTTSATAPLWVLVTIGLLNGTANFFMATSQPHTPGITQSLLNQLNIPIVLVLCAIFLRKRTSLVAILGSLLIVVGTAISASRPGGGSSSCGSNKCYAVSSLLFAVAQLFLAGERVFEEHTFDSSSTDVLNMFSVTLFTQFFLGFALYPVQTFEPFGDLIFHEIPRVVWDGVRCNVGLGPTEDVAQGPTCGFFSSFIFFAYCCVDYLTYGFGLYVIRNGGAREMVVASAVALPLQQIVLCLPFLGIYSESFFWGDAVALLLVLAGFLVYQALSPEGALSASQRKPSRPPAPVWGA